ncbi:hypothetical protein ALC62_15828, partial [Cyphomyrmex costatus]
RHSSISENNSSCLAKHSMALISCKAQLRTETKTYETQSQKGATRVGGERRATRQGGSGRKGGNARGSGRRVGCESCVPMIFLSRSLRLMKSLRSKTSLTNHETKEHGCFYRFNYCCHLAKTSRNQIEFFKAYPELMIGIGQCGCLEFVLLYDANLDRIMNRLYLKKYLYSMYMCIVCVCEMEILSKMNISMKLWKSGKTDILTHNWNIIDVNNPGNNLKNNIFLNYFWKSLNIYISISNKI